MLLNAKTGGETSNPPIRAKRNAREGSNHLYKGPMRHWMRIRRCAHLLTLAWPSPSVFWTPRPNCFGLALPHSDLRVESDVCFKRERQQTTWNKRPATVTLRISLSVSLADCVRVEIKKARPVATFHLYLYPRMFQRYGKMSNNVPAEFKPIGTLQDFSATHMGHSETFLFGLVVIIWNITGLFSGTLTHFLVEDGNY